MVNSSEYLFPDPNKRISRVLSMNETFKRGLVGAAIHTRSAKETFFATVRYHLEKKSCLRPKDPYNEQKEGIRERVFYRSLPSDS
jgi:hypothetical protein